MEAAFAELPLALFSTLAPLGAGAFVVLALALIMGKFTPEQLKKIDQMTLIPLAVVILGFICAFFHLASPLNSMGVFAGTGSSPLSNELVAGVVFAVVTIVYCILALSGKLDKGVRKPFAAVVAVLAIVFCAFVGMAYLMPTIPSWNTPLLPFEIICFALVGGGALAALSLGLAKTFSIACESNFKIAIMALALIGGIVGAALVVVHTNSVNDLWNPLISGTSLVEPMMPWAIAAAVLLVAAGIAMVPAVVTKNHLVWTVVALVISAAGIFIARLVFYALQISIGLA